MEQEIQTPAEENEETPIRETPADDSKRTDAPVDQGAGEGENYKVKFAESTRENQRISSDNDGLRTKQVEDRATIARLEDENRKVLEKLKDEDPDSFNAHQLREANEKTAKELATIKENQELDSFVNRTPGAENYREALRNLGRSTPSKSYGAIWKETFSAVAAADAKATKDKTSRGKGASPETGKGTVTPEPSGDSIGGHTPEEFNKLPLDKRRAILKKRESKSFA